MSTDDPVVSRGPGLGVKLNGKNSVRLEHAGETLDVLLVAAEDGRCELRFQGPRSFGVTRRWLPGYGPNPSPDGSPQYQEKRS